MSLIGMRRVENRQSVAENHLFCIDFQNVSDILEHNPKHITYLL